VDGWHATKNQNPSFITCNFSFYLVVDLSTGSSFFPLFGDDASGHRARWYQSSFPEICTFLSLPSMALASRFRSHSRDQNPLTGSETGNTSATSDEEHDVAAITRRLPRDLCALGRCLDQHDVDSATTTSTMSSLQGEMTKMSEMLLYMNANFSHLLAVDGQNFVETPPPQS
jgi:hypothetical protein